MCHRSDSVWTAAWRRTSSCLRLHCEKPQGSTLIKIISPYTHTQFSAIKQLETSINLRGFSAKLLKHNENSETVRLQNSAANHLWKVLPMSQCVLFPTLKNQRVGWSEGKTFKIPQRVLQQPAGALCTPGTPTILCVQWLSVKHTGQQFYWTSLECLERVLEGLLRIPESDNRHSKRMCWKRQIHGWR